MAQYDPIAVKTGIPTVFGTDTPRIDLAAVAGLTTAALASGDACQVSAALTMQKAVNTSTSAIVGVYNGTSGSVVREGVVVATFAAGPTTAGETVYLSGTAGALTNVKPTKDMLHEVGVVVEVASRKVLLQPKPVIVLPPSPPQSVWLAGYGSYTHQYLTPAWTDQGAVSPGDNLVQVVLWDGNYIWTFTSDATCNVRKYDPITRALVSGPYLIGGIGGMYSGWSHHAAFDGTNYWVANGMFVTSVKKFDAGGTVLATVSVGASVGYMTYDGAGSLLVTDRNNTTVKKVNTTTNAVTSVALADPVNGSGVCYGGYYYQPTYRGAYPCPEWMYKINVATMAIEAGWPKSMGFGNYSNSHAIATDGVYLWCAHDSSVAKNALSDAGLIGMYATGGGVEVQDLCYDGAWVWGSYPAASKVVKIDPATGACVLVAAMSASYGICTTAHVLPWS